jgi:hypothetical protein
MPLLIAPLAILRVASSALGAVSRTPVLDGAIAMVPGLAAQSRVDGNPELERLMHRAQRSGVDYALVGSDFQPSDAGWRFWRWFRKGRIANAAAALASSTAIFALSVESPSEQAPKLKARAETTAMTADFIQEPL